MRRRYARVSLWLLVLPLLAVAGGFKHVDHNYWPRKYDHNFKKYSKRYFGVGFDWRWFKSQGIAESNLKPGARSRAGATGIMQILPSTFGDLKKKNPHFKTIADPRWNIAAGIYYDRQMFRKWDNMGDRRERLNLTFASYNAGYGRIRRAYKKAAAKSPVEHWSQVAPFAPSQTRHYVRRIHALMRVKS